MLESFGVLSKWTIEVKVRKDAALISCTEMKKNVIQKTGQWEELIYTDKYIMYLKHPQNGVLSYHKLFVRNL